MRARLHTVPAAPLSGEFLRAYAVHMRPYLLFVSGITGIAGLSHAADFSSGVGVLLAAAFFLSYGFGQALTDCFQTDTDSISSPYRPLVRGTIRRRDVLVTSVVGLTACGVVMTAGNLNAVPLAILGICGLASYTYFKRLWWAGPFYNAWIVAVVYLLGVLDGSAGSGFGALWDPRVVVTATVVFFGYANFVLSGYFKDISADRATSYDTLPVRFGMKVSALVSDVFAALAVCGTGTAVYLIGAAGSLPPVIPLLTAAVGAAVVLIAQIRLHRLNDEREAHRAINPVVHAYVLLLSAVIIANQPEWTPFAAVFYAAFWVTMRRRPATEQI